MPGSAATVDTSTVDRNSPPEFQMAKAFQGGLAIMPPAADPVVDPGKPVRDYWDDVWAATSPGSYLWTVARSVLLELSYYDRWDPVVYAAWCERQKSRTPDGFGLYPNG